MNIHTAEKEAFGVSILHSTRVDITLRTTTVAGPAEGGGSRNVMVCSPVEAKFIGLPFVAKAMTTSATRNLASRLTCIIVEIGIVVIPDPFSAPNFIYTFIGGVVVQPDAKCAPHSLRNGGSESDERQRQTHFIPGCLCLELSNSTTIQTVAAVLYRKILFAITLEGYGYAMRLPAKELSTSLLYLGDICGENAYFFGLAHIIIHTSLIAQGVDPQNVDTGTRTGKLSGFRI
ncbi:hypothetical protein BDV25DRAFT_139896 [Aspergillus avenaceus]|uniref:Uncharacterized protein n=1 Tax=Aspergillus avenaceus TaxID=36643 RepID=A0A5N6TVU2_ASPAV|nr:hypothetical protein BDV25DRAFT_139896 [Aspergillus avenaceus]